MVSRDMSQCLPAAWLRALSSAERFRPWVLRVALLLERGQFYSLTARWIMSNRYGVDIGDYSYGSCFVPCAFAPGVTVGRYVSVGPEVRVFLRNHPTDRLSTHPFFFNPSLAFVPQDYRTPGRLEIGHDAWIGARAIILRACRRIGIGAVVGAGSVVTKEVPDFAIVAGNPARIIGRRFDDETCVRVLRSKWWEHPVGACVSHLQDMKVSAAGLAPNHPLLNARSALEQAREGSQPAG